MSNFLLQDDEKNKDIIKIEVTSSYSFNPKIKETKVINAKTITIYDENILEKILAKKYQKRYQRLLKIINDIISSDDATDGDYLLCLDEIDKLKGILLYKYQKYIKSEDYLKFLNDLVYIDSYVKDIMISKVENETRGAR